MKDEAKTAEKKMRENQKGRDSTVGREKEEEKREKEKGKRKGGEKGGAVAIFSRCGRPGRDSQTGRISFTR